MTLEVLKRLVSATKSERAAVEKLATAIQKEQTVLMEMLEKHANDATLELHKATQDAEIHINECEAKDEEERKAV